MHTAKSILHNVNTFNRLHTHTKHTSFTGNGKIIYIITSHLLAAYRKKRKTLLDFLELKKYNTL